MEIKRVNTLAFAVSACREAELEKRLVSGTGKFLGLLSSERPEVRKGYFPVMSFQLVRPEVVRHGISTQSSFERKENNFFVNMNSGVLYHVRNNAIVSYELVNKLLNASEESIAVLGQLLRHGEVKRDEINPVVVMELANLGLIKVYKPAIKEFYTLVMDEIASESDESRHIRHTIVKERVSVNFHIPRYDDPGYDLSSLLAAANTMVEAYYKEPIKYSVDQVAEVLKKLFQAEASISGMFFLPYVGGSYHKKKNAKEERLAEIFFPVCFKGAKADVKEGVEIKPISLSTEVGAAKAVPIERETINFSDVAGLDDVKKEIREEIIYPLTRPDLAKEYGRKGGGSILLYGPPGCGKTYVARATIGECGAAFYNINISDLVKRGYEDGAKALHEVFESAGKNPPAIIFLDEFDAIGGKRAFKQAQSHGEKMLINQLLTEMDGVESMKDNILFIAATNAPWAVDPAFRRAERFTKQLFVPPPNLEKRENLLRLHTKNEPLDIDVDFHKIAELTEGYSSADLKALCDASAKIPWEEALESGVERRVTMADYMKAVGKHQSSLTPWYKEAYKMLEDSGEWEQYKDYAAYIMKHAGGVDLVKKPQISFKNVGDLENVKEEIRRSIIYPLAREDLAKEFGKNVGGGILLYGPPGCGKTYIAKATAGECNAAFFNITLTDVLAQGRGESEKKIKEIFERAWRNTPAIVFFDEIESIVGRRDAAAMSDVRMVDAFLTEMDGFKKAKGLVIIGATNAPWAVDPAVRRSERFTKQMFVPPPDYDARVEIFKIHCQEKPVSPDLDYERLADLTAGYTSSDVKAICDAASEIPWAEALKGGEERKISLEDFEKALKNIKSSLIPWINTAKRELEKSGEKGIYPELDSLLADFEAYGKEDFKELIEQEKMELAAKQKEELASLESKRDEVEGKIKLAQQKYYRREIAPDSFKSIFNDYEKQLIELDIQIRKLKCRQELNKTEKDAANNPPA